MPATDKSTETQQMEATLQSFEAQKKAYFETMQKVHDMLASNATPSLDFFNRRAQNRGASSGSNTPKDQTARAVVSDFGVSKASTAGAPSLFSKGTGEESDDEHDDDQLYAQELLSPASFDQEGLREHLINTAWDEYGWEILKDILGNGAINNASHGRHHSLFPTQSGPAEDRSHLSGHQVWDIGSDGAPLAVESFGDENEGSKAMAIWHCIKDINPSSKDRKAVGRITIMRELSPVLYGALHYTLSSTFDMDEIFKQLIVADGSTADVHRAFDLDSRRQSSKVFVFQYFTIIGEDCRPMPWQLSSDEIDKNPKHIRITRCNSVVALALTGKPIRKVRPSNVSKAMANTNRSEIHHAVLRTRTITATFTTLGRPGTC